MKNLNKFTKAELISKFKNLENKNSNKNNLVKIFDYILLFKSLILKITLIAFIIRWIKKYSLIRKLWHVFNLIGSTLLGISLIDIYYWDVISSIRDTSIYKWYSDLMGWSKIEIKSTEIKDISSVPRTNWEETAINSENRQNNRTIIEKIINKESNENKTHEILSKEELKNLETTTGEIDKTNYKKYFLIGSMLIVTGITIWCYFNDIKPGDAANTVIEKIKSSRSWFYSDESNINNSNTGNNSTNIQTNVNSDIQISENSSRERLEKVVKDKIRELETQPVASSSRVLTSPSLENLNEQAESSWSESSSVSSPDSDKTVTQASISSVTNLISNNWRGKLTKEVNNKINFIESCFQSENNLEDGTNLADYFAFITNEYNNEVNTYNFMKSNSNFNDPDLLKSMKESIYCFREWIAEYQNKIFPSSNVTIEIGTINDSPKILNKNIV